MKRRLVLAVALLSLIVGARLFTWPAIKRHKAMSMCTTIQKGTWDGANGVCKFTP